MDYDPNDSFDESKLYFQFIQQDQDRINESILENSNSHIRNFELSRDIESAHQINSNSRKSLVYLIIGGRKKI